MNPCEISEREECKSNRGCQVLLLQPIQIRGPGRRTPNCRLFLRAKARLADAETYVRSQNGPRVVSLCAD